MLDKSASTAQDIYNVICKMLDEEEWKYEKDEENLRIQTGARGDDLPMAITIRVYTDLEIVSLLSLIPFTVPEDKRDALAVAVARANNGMVDGSFDYKYQEGRIVFRLTACYSGTILDKEAFRYMLYVSCSTIDEYNDKFLTISKSDMSVEDIIKYIQ